MVGAGVDYRRRNAAVYHLEAGGEHLERCAMWTVGTIRALEAQVELTVNLIKQLTTAGADALLTSLYRLGGRLLDAVRATGDEKYGAGCQKGAKLDVRLAAVADCGC